MTTGLGRSGCSPAPPGWTQGAPLQLGVLFSCLRTVGLGQPVAEPGFIEDGGEGLRLVAQFAPQPLDQSAHGAAAPGMGRTPDAGHRLRVTWHLAGVLEEFDQQPLLQVGQRPAGQRDLLLGVVDHESGVAVLAGGRRGIGLARGRAAQRGPDLSDQPGRRTRLDDDVVVDTQLKRVRPVHRRCRQSGRSRTAPGARASVSSASFRPTPTGRGRAHEVRAVLSDQGTERNLPSAGPAKGLRGMFCSKK